MHHLHPTFRSYTHPPATAVFESDNQGYQTDSRTECAAWLRTRTYLVGIYTPGW